MSRSAYGKGPRHVGRPQPTRPILKRARDCITGLYPSSKPAMSYRMSAYEGALAGDYVKVIDADTSVVQYREEPHGFRWYDPRAQRMARYTPDYLVHYSDGRIECVEVRPIGLLAELSDPRVINERRLAAREAGYSDYRVVTEHDINRVRLTNAKILAHTRRFTHGSERFYAAMRTTVARLGGKGTILELRRASGLGPHSWRSVIGLIARGELVPISEERPLDDLMRVYDPKCWAEGEIS